MGRSADAVFTPVCGSPRSCQQGCGRIAAAPSVACWSVHVAMGTQRRAGAQSALSNAEDRCAVRALVIPFFAVFRCSPDARTLPGPLATRRRHRPEGPPDSESGTAGPYRGANEPVRGAGWASCLLRGGARSSHAFAAPFGSGAARLATAVGTGWCPSSGPCRARRSGPPSQAVSGPTRAAARPIGRATRAGADGSFASAGRPGPTSGTSLTAVQRPAATRAPTSTALVMRRAGRASGTSSRRRAAATPLEALLTRVGVAVAGPTSPSFGAGTAAGARGRGSDS